MADSSNYQPSYPHTADSFPLVIDGKVVGPGPAHYSSPHEAVVNSADWLWIFAEASRRCGGKSHHHEWATLVFQAADGRFGFLSPQPFGEYHGGGPSTFQLHRIAVGKGAQRVVFMHSHPRGARAIGTAGKKFSGIELEDDGTFSGDEAAAIQYPALWIGLLAPDGAVMRIRFKESYRNQLPPDTIFGRQMPMTNQLWRMYRRHKREMFDRHHDRGRVGRNWIPWNDEKWREKCIAEIVHEMQH